MKTINYDTIEMSDKQRDQFDLLAERLVERNRQVNLTAITDPEEIRETRRFPKTRPSAFRCILKESSDIRSSQPHCSGQQPSCE